MPRGGRCPPPAPLNCRAAPRQGQPRQAGSLDRPFPHRLAARRGREKPLPAPAPERPAEQGGCRPPRGTPAAPARTNGPRRRARLRARPPPPLLLLRGRGAAAAAAAAQLPICPLFTAASTSSSSGPSPPLRSHPPRGAGTGTLPPRRSTAGSDPEHPDSAPPPPGGTRAAALKRQRPFLGLARLGHRGRGPWMRRGISVSYGGTVLHSITFPMGAAESGWSVHLSQKKCSK